MRVIVRSPLVFHSRPVIFRPSFLHYINVICTLFQEKPISFVNFTMFVYENNNVLRCRKVSVY